ncbi:hypothetical protein [Cellulophaga sp. Asnod2-G02]|uniref:hypothetical protein n=1 Tax=Cellulophaga sp. Asnod2-G02 TaxID=3160572 RepID=UPI00386864FF
MSAASEVTGVYFYKFWVPVHFFLDKKRTNLPAGGRENQGLPLRIYFTSLFAKSNELAIAQTAIDFYALYGGNNNPARDLGQPTDVAIYRAA